jgi:large subunit ribosomal protein L4
VKLDVFDIQKNKVGELELDDSVFAAKVNQGLFWEVVRNQLANRRAGTHSTKTVTTVNGTGKKPFRQKGTGRARQGSLRASHMVGGGVVHGPHPRDYSYKMPKKMVKGALRSALSLRASESKLHIIKGWAPNAPKTKDAKAVLGRFDAGKALVVGSRGDKSLELSLRNLPTAKFLPVEGLNVYDVLAFDNLILTESVVAGIVDRLKAAPSRKDRGE